MILDIQALLYFRCLPDNIKVMDRHSNSLGLPRDLFADIPQPYQAQDMPVRVLRDGRNELMSRSENLRIGRSRRQLRAGKIAKNGQNHIQRCV